MLARWSITTYNNRQVNGELASDLPPEILETVQDLVNEPFILPEDIKMTLKANKQVWANFKRYSGSYQPIRIAYVDTARKRPEEFEKRLNNLIKKTEQDKQFGFGIETYY